MDCAFKTKYVLSYFWSLELIYQVRELASDGKWEKLSAVIELAQDEKLANFRPLLAVIDHEVQLCYTHAKYRQLFIPLFHSLQRDSMRGEVGAVDLSQVYRFKYYFLLDHFCFI
jgi:hypothetical protein